MSTNELLHRVELCALSERAKRELADLIDERVRAALAEFAPRKRHREGLTASETAAYLGVGKTRFYKMLQEDPTLAALAYRVGKRDRRWRSADLDRWLEAQREKPMVLKDAA